MARIRTTKRARVISFVKIISELNRSIMGRVIDISARGMRIRSKKRFRTDRPFHFSMLMPNVNLQEKVIKFDASIVWSEKSKIDGYFESGLEIESVTPQERSLIKQFIEDSSYRERWIQVNECISQEY